MTPRNAFQLTSLEHFSERMIWRTHGRGLRITCTTLPSSYMTAVIKVLRSFPSTNCDRNILSVKERVWAKKHTYLFVITHYLFETLLWGLPFFVCACPKVDGRPPPRARFARTPGLRPLAVVRGGLKNALCPLFPGAWLMGECESLVVVKRHTRRCCRNRGGLLRK